MDGMPVERSADLYLLDDDLPSEAAALVARVRSFVNDALLPVANDYWERAAFPRELLPQLAELRITGTTISGYGCPGLTRLEAGLISREIARGDGSFNTFFGVHSGLAMGTIAALGSEQQKQTWLPSMAGLELIGAFALTEPDHGSDSVALETTARREGDEYVLSGRKRWIGNGSIADIVVVWARDVADAKVKAFVIERSDRAMPPGYTANVITGKIGKRAILQADILLEDVRIPAANKLEASRSFADATAVLSATRGGAAWESLGHAIAAYEIALDYCRRREQFGRPIASYQLVQNKLANMLAELTAIRLMCDRLATLATRGLSTGPMASVAKMFAAQKARAICLDARDLLGGNGLLLENHIARHIGDMEVVHTYEGTDFIQSLLIGREITGFSAFK